MIITRRLGTCLALLCSASAYAGHHESGHTGEAAEIGKVRGPARARTETVTENRRR